MREVEYEQVEQFTVRLPDGVNGLQRRAFLILPKFFTPKDKELLLRVLDVMILDPPQLEERT